MIRVRTTDGKLYAMKDSARFIEICDDSGNVGAVVLVGDDSIRVVSVEDEEFRKYLSSFKLKQSRVMDFFNNGQ